MGWDAFPGMLGRGSAGLGGMPRTGTPLQGTRAGAAGNSCAFPHFGRRPRCLRARSRRRALKKPSCPLIAPCLAHRPGVIPAGSILAPHERMFVPGLCLWGPEGLGLERAFLGAAVGSGCGAGLPPAPCPASTWKISRLSAVGSVCAGGEEGRIPKDGPEASPPSAAFPRLCPG